MIRHSLFTLVAIAAVSIAAASAAAQGGGPEDESVALIYHKISREALDFSSIAQRSRAVVNASSFDRPDVLKAEIARLEQLLASADASHELVARVNDNVSAYDHDRGEFSIQLFQPGYFVEVSAFGQQYKLVFANAESARPIPMPKEQARAFDATLSARGRMVVNEIHYRVIGAGDPAGAVTGPHVVRAEIVSARLLDAEGHVVYTPTIKPVASDAAGGVELAGKARDVADALDPAKLDVAGFRIGVKVKDLDATLTRLFGRTSRYASRRPDAPGLAGVLTYNELGCSAMMGRRQVHPGAVCVIAQFDENEVVRTIRVERVFSWMDPEAFRRAVVARYGPVASAIQGGGYALGWGPEIPMGMRYGGSPSNALTARWLENDSQFLSGNRISEIRIVLHLADAAWANSRSR